MLSGWCFSLLLDPEQRFSGLWSQTTKLSTWCHLSAPNILFWGSPSNKTILKKNVVLQAGTIQVEAADAKERQVRGAINQFRSHSHRMYPGLLIYAGKEDKLSKNFTQKGGMSENLKEEKSTSRLLRSCIFKRKVRRFILREQETLVSWKFEGTIKFFKGK